MYLLKWATVVLMFSCCCAAKADSLTAEMLFDNCRVVDPDQMKNADYPRASYCLGFINGFMESASVHRAMVAGKVLPNNVNVDGFSCPPNDGITARQAHAIFMKFINDNPQEMHQSARVVLYIALRKAFPCQ